MTRITPIGMEPFYFGTAAQPLFGCHHVPRTPPRRNLGVVLCNPLGDEYIRSHRAYGQLARLLCNAGFHTLRFDFYGCGDSAGESDQGTVSQWLQDISVAAGELKDKSGLTRVCLVGLRFGATLAAFAGVELGNIEAMVLWNPVVKGKAHLEEVKTLHQQVVPTSHESRGPDFHEGYTELLGFPFTPAMINDLQSLDLFAVRQKPATKILVAESTEQASCSCLLEHLRSCGANLDHRHIPDHKIWTVRGKALVPTQIMQAMVSWITGLDS